MTHHLVETDADRVARKASLIVYAVMAEGAKRYGEQGFETRTDVDDCFTHALQHLLNTGLDQAGSEDHLAHAITRLAMMAYMIDKQEVSNE